MISYTERIRMTEREYHELPVLNYTGIKTFLDDRKRFFRKYILETVTDDSPEQDDDNLRMGSLVDCLLLSPDDVDDRYIITGAEVPVGQMMEFVNNLYKRTILATDEEGILTEDFDTLITKAYEDTKYDKSGKEVAFKKKSLEKLKEEFLIKKIGLDYYLELRDRQNKIVITEDELNRANMIVQALKSHVYTRGIVNQTTDSRYTVYNQHIIVGEYAGVSVKCMIDKVIVDEEKKIVQPYDLKTTWNVEQFDANYLKYRYYIQNALYTSLLRSEFVGYDVRPMSFIVTDKFMYMDPLIYETDEDNLKEAKNGFVYRGVEYVGLDKAVEDIKFHKETSVWTVSADLQKCNGKTKVNKYGKNDLEKE